MSNETIVKENVKTSIRENFNKYDENGNLIHNITTFNVRDTVKKLEFWTDYDNNGRKIHYKNSTGAEVFFEYDELGRHTKTIDKNGDTLVETRYDEKGRKIYYKAEEYEAWANYDDIAKKVHYKESTGYQSWKDFNDKGQVISFRDNQGYHEISSYDEHTGNLKITKTRDETNTVYECECDSNGNIIYVKNEDGIEHWYTYNDKNKETLHKCSDGYECHHEYDAHGNEISCKSNKGTNMHTEYEYNENGKVIHIKRSDNFEAWYEYDDNGNCTYSKEIKLRKMKVN